ncbi:hypothetical protein EXU57_13310 [Segetibacter sp. 3557_3]|uniref:hypothetical protein n=1 Tax=Segetibacter sp. 3557_3 TaxID=2547429 RepID=UPI001058C685|nr:hypothetical protein [Segetibacter sp. 3557_3]TDH25673.1 hypothetical protein EXU57_13310 [Segetibacter sp. 3557_3]
MASVDKDQKQPVNADTTAKADEKQAAINKAAHDQAEADIEADIELTDVAGPQEDMDEGEIFARSDDRNDLT